HRARRRGKRPRRALALRPGPVVQRGGGAGRGHLGPPRPHRPRAAPGRAPPPRVVTSRELPLPAPRAVAAGDTLGLLELVERLSEYGADHRNFTRELILHFREILLLKTAPEASALLTSLVPEERERLRPLAEAYSEEDLLRILD